MRLQSYNPAGANYVPPALVSQLADPSSVDTSPPLLSDAEKEKLAWDARKDELRVKFANRVNGGDPREADAARELVDTVRMLIEDTGVTPAVVRGFVNDAVKNAPQVDTSSFAQASDLGDVAARVTKLENAKTEPSPSPAVAQQ